MNNWKNTENWKHWLDWNFSRQNQRLNVFTSCL